jgi:NADH-quinone oxidoreductase subunit C
MTSLEEVPTSEWLAALRQARAAGFTMVDLVTAVDWIDELEVVVVLTDPDSAQRCLLSTRLSVDHPELPSVSSVLDGASWHERETAEMFGIVFTGHPDPRPLILREAPSSGVPPLRKASALAERVARPWPGAPSGDGARRARRPQPSPGVRDEWMPTGEPA